MHLTANAAILALLARGDVPSVVPQVLYEFWVVSTRPVAVNGRGLDPVDVAAELATTRADFVRPPPVRAVVTKHLEVWAVCCSAGFGVPSGDASPRGQPGEQIGEARGGCVQLRRPAGVEEAVWVEEVDRAGRRPGGADEVRGCPGVKPDGNEPRG